MARFTATLSDNTVARRGAATLDLTIYEDGDPATLAGMTVVFEVKNSAGETVIQKVSTDAEQIDISSNVGTIFFVGGDTDDLGASGTYYCDAWVYDTEDIAYQCLEKQRFRIGPTVHDPDPTPPGPPSGIPLRQSNVWRRFLFTWPSLGDTATVTIPETGMLNATYAISYSFYDDNGGGLAALEFSGLSTTDFDVEATGDIAANAVICFVLTDI